MYVLQEDVDRFWLVVVGVFDDGHVRRCLLLAQSTITCRLKDGRGLLTLLWFLSFLAGAMVLLRVEIITAMIVVDVANELFDGQTVLIYGQSMRC